jgi:hypothetical protein
MSDGTKNSSRKMRKGHRKKLKRIGREVSLTRDTAIEWVLRGTYSAPIFSTGE